MRDEAAAQRGVADLDRATDRGRDVVGAEDEVDQRRDGVEAAVDDRDLLGRHPLLADQARDLGGDQLDLGALAAAFERDDGAPGPAASTRGASGS